MKTPRILALLAALAVMAFVIRHSSFVIAQGPLTAPGAPAPTMKTLDQLEARTPISSAPFTITAPGSYYLTGNLSVTTGTAITIQADHVTLDLNGFTISSTASPASGSGVLFFSTRRNVTVRNGHIRGTTTFAAGVFTTGGFSGGINHSSGSSANLRISDVDVHGVAGDGIDLGINTVPTFTVERCTVSVCGNIGIRAALVRDCGVLTTGGFGMEADIASHCAAEAVGAGAGSFGVNARTSVDHCRGSAIGGFGVGGPVVSHCVGISTAGIAGIRATGGTVCFSQGQRDGGTAISTFNAIGCTVSGTGTVTAANKTLGTP